MRRRMWLPLAALALGLVFLGGVVVGIVIQEDSDGGEGRPRTESASPTATPSPEQAFLGVVLGGEAEGGVLVQEVLPGSAAEDAALRPGDIIVALDGREVRDAGELMALLDDKGPGDSVTITFTHEGRRHEAETVLGGRPAEQPRTGATPAPSAGNARLGIAVRDITPELRDGLRLTPERGVVVVGVTPGGPADEAGVRIRDVVLSIDDRPVETAAALAAAVRERSEGDRVKLIVQRDERRLTLDVELGAGAGLAPPTMDEGQPAPAALDFPAFIQELREVVPDLDLEAGGPQGLLRRFVKADLTLLTVEGEPTTLHVTAGTVRNATDRQVVLAPHGGGADVTFGIDGETRVFRGFRRVDAGEIEGGETAVVLTRDDEKTARLVFVLPAALGP